MNHLRISVAIVLLLVVPTSSASLVDVASRIVADRLETYPRMAVMIVNSTTNMTSQLSNGAVAASMVIADATLNGTILVVNATRDAIQNIDATPACEGAADVVEAVLGRRPQPPDCTGDVEP